MNQTSAPTNSAPAATSDKMSAAADDGSSKERLEEDIRDLESKAATGEAEAQRENRRNNIFLAAAAAVGLCGAAVAILLALTNVWVGRANSRLREVENRLNTLRMAKIKADADVQIAEAKKEAGEANKEAGRANERAELANREAARIEAEGKERVAKVEAESREKIAALNAEAERAREGIATAQTEAARAKERAEREAYARVELEKSLSRRSIPFVRIGRKTTLDSLTPYAGMQAVIEFVPDWEPRRAARSLMETLSGAGWKVVSVTPNPALGEPFWDGVVVQSYLGSTAGRPIEEIRDILEARKRPGDAATVLVNFLKTHNWAAHKFPADRDLPPNTVKVLIGFKPEPAVGSPLEQEFRRETGQAEERPLPQQRTERRRLTPELRKLFFKGLEGVPFGGPIGIKVPVEIRCPEGNDEACDFATEIAELLKSINWPMVNNEVVRDRNFPRRLTGLLILAQEVDQTFGSAALHSGFATMGLEVTRDLEILPNEPLQVLVGW